jgi:protein ImuA
MWLPTVRAEALRRLQVAAQDGDALAFLMRPARAATQSSPAPLRIVCDAAGGARLEQAGLRLTIMKRRGPVLEAPVCVSLPLRADERSEKGMHVTQPAPVFAGVEVGGEAEAGHVVDRRRVAVAAA